MQAEQNLICIILQKTKHFAKRKCFADFSSSYRTGFFSRSSMRDFIRDSMKDYCMRDFSSSRRHSEMRMQHAFSPFSASGTLFSRIMAMAPCPREVFRKACPAALFRRSGNGVLKGEKRKYGAGKSSPLHCDTRPGWSSCNISSEELPHAFFSNAFNMLIVWMNKMIPCDTERHLNNRLHINHLKR